MIEISNIKTPQNLALAYTRLLTNTESTYKNYFRSVYATYGMANAKNLKNLSAKLKSGYIPEQAYKVYAPKTNGLSRMYTLMSIDDQIVYQAFANKLADQMQLDSIRARYKKTVFGNLYNGKGKEFFYQNWESAYKAYTGAIIKSYQAGNEYIASFDLTACYDSINHNLLKDILTRFRFSSACATDLIRLLEAWCSPSSKYVLGVGIPQGPQASGIIAEAVLSEYDKFIEEKQKLYNFSYFRYVDDIKILAKDKETVLWILCLLDQKSKELGLFPQASKVSVHKVVNILDEVKQISKPLFDDDIEESMKSAEAACRLSELIRSSSKDTTSIKRYLQYLEPCAKNNKLAIRFLQKYPETLASFVYYIQRYPRKLPASIVSLIRDLCVDKTKQYYAGMLLRVSVFNLSKSVMAEFGKMANNLLKRNNKERFIYDPLYKEQLYILLILGGKYTVKTYVKRIGNESNWWIRQQLISDLTMYGAPNEIVSALINQSITNPNPDESLVASMSVVLKQNIFRLPPRAKISGIAQEALKSAGIINRSKYSSSQINRYLEIITEEKWSFPWKKLLGDKHDVIERFAFAACCYWKTDITAFVNLWDSIDDQILYILTSTHIELGGYTLGQIGGIENSKKLKNALPCYLDMINTIHKLRLSSFLSHSITHNTGKYTGPIPFKEKKKIANKIKNGMRELENYWKK